MTIAEKIQYAADKKVVTFFKEGLFYKCYNEDAMVFTKKVRAYKVKVKYVKNVGSKVLSLGFPISEIEKENLKLHYLEYCDTIQISTDIVTEKQFEYNKTTNDLLVKMILEFDLANSTPLQGLVFIQELKKHIKTQD